MQRYFGEMCHLNMLTILFDLKCLLSVLRLQIPFRLEFKLVAFSIANFSPSVSAGFSNKLLEYSILCISSKLVEDRRSDLRRENSVIGCKALGANLG